MKVLPDSKFIDTYYFTNQIEKELDEVKLNLASGSCISYDEYKYMVGIIKGMEKSLTVLQDISNQFSDPDEE
mgnify:CR=1 FL=1|jgi:hypothetical protein|tara:strand:+ start:966 stop:1181 length:216 start_codon:yes stop_codon:yes gene_type:complete